MIEIIERSPSVDEFQSIVESVGFRDHDPSAVKTALENTVFSVCAMEGTETVGMGRIVGDRAVSFLLTNVIVRPSHQRNGIGTGIVQSLCDLMDSFSNKNIVLEVAPLPGLESFYRRCGFKSSREAPPSMVRWFNETGS